MLETYARALESIIKHPKGTKSRNAGDKTTITWSNPQELEAYIAKLQAAADRLTSENRKLRKYHCVCACSFCCTDTGAAMFTDKVLELMSTDLLKQAGKWKETLGFLRNSCAELQSRPS